MQIERKGAYTCLRVCIHVHVVHDLALLYSSLCDQMTL